VAARIGSRKPVLWEDKSDNSSSNDNNNQRKKKKAMVKRTTSNKAATTDILAEYRRIIEEGIGGKDDGKSGTKNRKNGQGRGAMLACVVGGKLSEGINFSDGLARCVAVVGMPYANSQDPLLKEKISWINRRFSCADTDSSAAKDGGGGNDDSKNAVVDGDDGEKKKSPGGSGGSGKKTGGDTASSSSSSAAFSSSSSLSQQKQQHQQIQDPGRQYYENLCMRAVNQSIGRSIRHKGDYACVLLIDQRYESDRISQQLPTWIRKRFEKPKGGAFGDAFRKVCKFFAEKRRQRSQ